MLMLSLTGGAQADLEVLGGSGFSAGVQSGGSPTTSNGTDFGTVTLPGSESSTFRLKNNSSSSVTIIQILVDGAAFDLTSGGVSGGVDTLAGNGTRNFTVEFDPNTAGTKSGTVSIVTIEEPLFSFDLEGEAVGEPEIVVRGRPFSPASYLSISDGDTTPRVDDGTAFGSWGAADGALTHTFEIENTGDDLLEIDSISLSQFSSAFSLSGVPTSVAAGGTRTFSVKFNPASHGTYTATVTIENNDPNEDPFTFEVNGTGRASGITVLGGTGENILILNGDDTPRVTDGTDFGTVDAGSAAVANTFKITNLGNEDLVFLSVITEDANAFSISSGPAALSSVAPGASRTFDVVLSTTAAGSKHGTVSIVTNDPNDGVFSFDVTA